MVNVWPSPGQICRMFVERHQVTIINLHSSFYHVCNASVQYAAATAAASMPTWFWFNSFLPPIKQPFRCQIYRYAGLCAQRTDKVDGMNEAELPLHVTRLKWKTRAQNTPRQASNRARLFSLLCVIIWWIWLSLQLTNVSFVCNFILIFNVNYGRRSLFRGKCQSFLLHH